MERRALGLAGPRGGAGPEVSRLGLGLAAVGRPGYINLGRASDLSDRSVEGLRARTHALLDAALAAGVTYVDAARSYGLAERFLGDWLRDANPTGRDLRDDPRLVIGSKWGYAYTADWRIAAERHEVKEHSAERLETQWGESLAALERPPDVYQIHSATLETGVLENADVLRGLAALAGTGVRIGLSVSGPRQAETIDRALEVRVDGVALFRVVQATWNLLERSAGPALARAHAAGLGVIVKEALANGRLGPRGDVGPTLGATGEAPDAVAIAAALAQPWADVVLSGAATVAQLASNLEAWRVREPERWSEAVTPQGAAEYWAARSALSWG